jgi:hypothetical protein
VTVVEARQAELVALQEQVCWRPGKRNISTFGAYSIALMRQHGHASAAACVAMVAGSDVHGKFKAKDICMKYETNLCVVQRLLTMEKSQDASLIWSDQIRESGAFREQCASLHPHSNFKLISVRGCAYRGDATQNDAVCHDKLHVSEVTQVVIDFHQFAGLSQEQLVTLLSDTSSIHAQYAFAVPNLMVVSHGTGAELYNIMLREFKSVSIESWSHSIARASLAADAASASVEGAVDEVEEELEAFGFALDKGPDNTSAIKMIQSATELCPMVLMFVVWCFLHQYQIAVRSTLD